MTLEQKRLLDGGILLQLHAAYPSSLTPKVLLSNLRLVGGMSRLTEGDLEERLRLLETAGRVERESDPTWRTYLITDEGRVWLAEAQLL